MRALVLGTPDNETLLREVVTQSGHDALAPLPAWHAGVAATERERFLVAVDRMMEADLLVADVRADGAAWCASWMLARGRLVVLTCPRDERARLTPMIAGNPSPWQRLVVHESEEDLRSGLARSLGA